MFCFKFDGCWYQWIRLFSGNPLTPLHAGFGDTLKTKCTKMSSELWSLILDFIPLCKGGGERLYCGLPICAVGCLLFRGPTPVSTAKADSTEGWFPPSPPPLITQAHNSNPCAAVCLFKTPEPFICSLSVSSIVALLLHRRLQPIAQSYFSRATIGQLRHWLRPFHWPVTTPHGTSPDQIRQLHSFLTASTKLCPNLTHFHQVKHVPSSNILLIPAVKFSLFFLYFLFRALRAEGQRQ